MEFRNYFREVCYAVECIAMSTVAVVVLMYAFITFS